MRLLSGKLNIQANGARISGMAEDANQQGTKVNKQIETWKRNRIFVHDAIIRRTATERDKQGRKSLYLCTCIRFNWF